MIESIGWIVAALLAALLGGLGLRWRIRSPEDEDEDDPPTVPRRRPAPEPIPEHEAPDHAYPDTGNPAGDFLDEHYRDRADE